MLAVAPLAVFSHYPGCYHSPQSAQSCCCSCLLSAQAGLALPSTALSLLCRPQLSSLSVCPTSVTTQDLNVIGRKEGVMTAKQPQVSIIKAEDSAATVTVKSEKVSHSLYMFLGKADAGFCLF